MPQRPLAPPFALSSLTLCLLYGLGQPAHAQDPTPEPPPKLKPSRTLAVRPKTERPALVITADKLGSTLDQQSSAEGKAELRYGDILMRADQVTYGQADDLAHATGKVELSSNGNIFRGPDLQLYVSRFEGTFLNPSYFFSLTGGAGHAERISFTDQKHVFAVDGTYSSCPVVDGQQPDWQITAKGLALDFDANEGKATGGVLHFLGVPILAAPSLSFALNGARKSGWLPPNISLDNRSGFELGTPYYWNIAPNRDATLTPFVMTKRGAGMDSEFRYLEPEHKGQLNLDLLPNDRVAGRSRWAGDANLDGQLPHDWRYQLRAEKVSDDDYWKDLPQRMHSKTVRLLSQDLQVNRARELGWGTIESYLRVQHWQALQGTDTTAQFITPYQRSPQLGIRATTKADDAVLDGFTPWGRSARLEGSLELEYNRFDLAGDALPTQRASGQVQTGERLHVLGHVSAPIGGAGWWLIPRVAVNAASYQLDEPGADGRRSMARTIPTFSLDSGLVFERDSSLLGRAMRQTLEPRVLYVNTPYRAQQNLPNFDSAAKDFNFDSIYSENQFTGVDRVSDAHTLTVGAISRWINPTQGEEVLRLGLVQRVQFRDQQITPDGTPITQRFSDLLLLAAAHLNEQWWADGTLQFNPESNRSERTVMRLRYSPGPFRTVSLAYRLARGQSEQVEVAWQWPLFGRAGAGGQAVRDAVAAGTSGGGGCQGAWYSAGRIQYSLFDKRLTDSVAGVEYDAGCWVMRMGVQRQSTGRAETNTRLMLQLELVGLSQLGSNALKVLRDNVPGYRQLSSDRSATLDGSSP
ncbi:LPS-assembly protein LptD [Pelomonas sp. KK5]|uniref:LPS-assembly protein LptD n=1 Tax=Pelomonas sp. KK5 TaxID=1855730 RepID=UPI0009FAD5B6|nr:LPS assembly protein LptD [Pelomonas sp. KK5]